MGRDEEVLLWTLNDKIEYELLISNAQLCSTIDISADGQYLIVAHSQNIIELFDLKEKKSLWKKKFHTQPITKVKFGPRIAVSSWDGSVSFWNLNGDFSGIIPNFDEGVTAMDWFGSNFICATFDGKIYSIKGSN